MSFFVFCHSLSFVDSVLTAIAVACACLLSFLLFVAGIMIYRMRKRNREERLIDEREITEQSGRNERDHHDRHIRNPSELSSRRVRKIIK